MNTTTIGRTNYFLTTDPKRLKELLEKTPNLKLWNNESNKEQFAFGGKNEELHLADNTVEEDDLTGIYDYLLGYAQEFQKILHPNDALIYIETEHTGLRSNNAYGIVITKTDVKEQSLNSILRETAREMMENPDYDTDMYY